jgi:hypothetical protein
MADPGPWQGGIARLPKLLGKAPRPPAFPPSRRRLPAPSRMPLVLSRWHVDRRGVRRLSHVGAGYAGNPSDRIRITKFEGEFAPTVEKAPSRAADEPPRLCAAALRRNLAIAIRG